MSCCCSRATRLPFSQGGGGYGSPYERDPAAVLNDVRSGLVSEAAAREQYGVILRAGQVDGEATRLLRAEAPKLTASFHYGEARERFEAVWSDELQLAVGAALAAYPLALRDYLKRRTMAEADRRIAAGEQVRPSDAADIMGEIHRKLLLG